MSAGQWNASAVPAVKSAAAKSAVLTIFIGPPPASSYWATLRLLATFALPGAA
jgi:hypothetical protein